LGTIVLIAGMVSGILGVVYALGQHDLKRLLAYHSVENIGIILIGIGIGMIGVAAGNPVMAVLGFAGGLLHVLNHAIFKSLLFMGAGMVLHKTGTRTSMPWGLIKNMPVTGTTFLVGSLAISGLPPFNGFVSEFLIYMGGFRGVAWIQRLCPEPAGHRQPGRHRRVGPGLFYQSGGGGFPGRTAQPCSPEHRRKRSMPCWSPWFFWPPPVPVIGIFPGLFMFMALKGVAALGLDYGRIPWNPSRMSANITLGATFSFWRYC
jgi:hydrogenase-4 component B